MYCQPVLYDPNRDIPKNVVEVNPVTPYLHAAHCITMNLVFAQTAEYWTTPGSRLAGKETKDKVEVASKRGA